MNYRIILIAIALAMVLGNARLVAAEPVNNVVNHPIPQTQKFTASQVVDTITLAGAKRHWRITPDGAGKLRAEQGNSRGVNAIVDISYTTTSYSITLVGSTGLNQQGPTDIDHRYNRWVVNLVDDIDRQFLTAPALPR